MNPSVTIKVGDITLKGKMSTGKPVEKWGQVMLKHIVTLIVDDRKSTFTYFNHTPHPTSSEIKDAIDCLVSDAFAGNQSYVGFCSECGYDPYEDAKEARQIYRACVSINDRLHYLGFDDDSLNKLFQKLYEESF